MKTQKYTYKKMTLKQKWDYQTTATNLLETLTRNRMKYIIAACQMDIATSSNASKGSNKDSLSQQMNEHFIRMKFKTNDDLRRALNELIRIKKLPRSENYKLVKRTDEIIRLGKNYTTPFEFYYLNQDNIDISDDDDDDDQEDSEEEPIYNQFKNFKFIKGSKDGNSFKYTTPNKKRIISPNITPIMKNKTLNNKKKKIN
eukprot:112407_1